MGCLRACSLRKGIVGSVSHFPVSAKVSLGTCSGRFLGIELKLTAALWILLLAFFIIIIFWHNILTMLLVFLITAQV